MKTYKGVEYIKIAIANAFGLDKLLFEDRIKWVNEQTMDELLANVPNAAEPAIYRAALYALEDAIAGRPSGFLVEFDACSSGIQIMGALMGCTVTCASTGLVDPNRRADIYTDVTAVINAELASKNIKVTPTRKAVKEALMTHFYGSTANPKSIFGEESQELKAFYDSLEQVAPGACIAMQHLMGAWQPYATEHKWSLPDGFEAVVPVVEAIDFRVEVDELDHATFTHRNYVNQGTKTGLSIAANVIHSIDALLVREMNRRCNHDWRLLERVQDTINDYWDLKYGYAQPADHSHFTSLRLAEMIDSGEISCETADAHLGALMEVIKQTLVYEPFPIVCVHDAFKCHANNMNHLRQNYINMFVQLAQSNLLEDILSEIHGTNYRLPKLGDVVSKIQGSNYALS